MNIAGREIGAGREAYVIAEVGVNHDGDVERALQLTDAAAEAGADAVKLQYFETDRLMSKAAKLAAYQKAAGETDPITMLRRLELTLDDCAKVIERAHERGVHAIVTVFSLETVEKTLALPWDAIKTASPDVVNRPLLGALMGDGRPMIVSTGAATIDEVRTALEWLGPVLGHLAVLQCVSSYPAPSLALEGIGAIAKLTKAPVGYSDHSAGVEAGGLAVACVASVLEKHLTYDRHAAGPDHAASLEPDGLRAYVELARRAHAERDRFVTNLGPPSKTVLDAERDVRTVSRQSVVATRDLPAGHVIARADVTVKRPGTGIPPWRLDEVVGGRTARAVAADVPMMDEDLAR